MEAAVIDADKAKEHLCSWVELINFHGLALLVFLLKAKNVSFECESLKHRLVTQQDKTYSGWGFPLWSWCDQTHVPHIWGEKGIVYWMEAVAENGAGRDDQKIVENLGNRFELSPEVFSYHVWFVMM